MNELGVTMYDDTFVVWFIVTVIPLAIYYCLYIPLNASTRKESVGLNDNGLVILPICMVIVDVFFTSVGMHVVLRVICVLFIDDNVQLVIAILSIVKLCRICPPIESC